MNKVAILIAALLTSSECLALRDFKCTVLDSVVLSSEGLLDKKSDLASNYIGKEFVVNRSTGQISGSGFTNTMSGQQPQVFEYLPEENAFKAITVYSPNYTVDYLQINTYAESAEKPFFYKGAFGTMVSGTCAYY